MRTPTFLTLLVAVALMQSAAFGQEAAEETTQEPEKMTVGSVAPPIDIEHWISTGNGKFEPINEFEPGNVYIVEFWATWCGPCVASMPHLVETQEKYADKGVTIISVSDEPLDTVTTFLEREVRSAEPEAQVQTYGELTSAYCLTTDPDSSVKKDYFLAAGQRGIPCAFIVGKDGHIEWFGHPMAMDKTLELVVTDQWDREAEQAAGEKIEAITQAASQAAQTGDYAKFDELLAELKGMDLPPGAAESVPGQIEMLSRIEMISKCTNAPAEVVAMLKDKGADMETRDLGIMASSIARNKDIDAELFTTLTGLLADRLEAGQDALALSNLLATMHAAQGDWDKAIEFQEKAVEAAGSAGQANSAQLKRIMESTLQRYQEEKAKEEATTDET
ncbi:redoxin domain-containing protein [Aeoliella mucimassa]|uniref:Thiol-disulfide oxidoreductase ResA n=1 Tax=Aeoliella mucimassa TaxID=2527972 RepID=A0A518ATQ3_9BACT|nr:redoxin domain-containing protein [Aeoliella mucimassa]QDU58109.1 Thiol-disulfide oxidoreductase ResA [Aeoliella mucimassa]